MLVNDNEAMERLNSPFNLMNRLRDLTNKKSDAKQALDIFTKKKESFNPFDKKDDTNIAKRSVSPDSNAISIDNLIDNADSQLQLATAHNNAVGVLNQAINELSCQIMAIKPDRLPSVIAATSKVIADIRKERIEARKERTGSAVHFHFYTPETKKLQDYDVIEVG